MKQLLILLSLTACQTCFSQLQRTPAPEALKPAAPQPGTLLPADTGYRYGKLSNGLTYYIRHNNYPEGYADFQIFHAVGAIQEEDNQNGLAHFLEHQAFKGLAHFPGKSMLHYMESIGVKFGANLNASTTTDYTRYMINQVPVSRQGIIDTCLLVLADWSGSILATPADIESERGVIKEEWRMRGGVNLRTSQALAPYLFKDSRYAVRSVIGDMDIISSFKREELMDFYHKWYRPDLQAIAIVGDFNVDAMEAAVKKRFSGLKNPKSPVAKIPYPLPDNKELIYGAYSDREATSSSVSLLFKHPRPERSRRQELSVYTGNYIRRLAVAMMNDRWAKISDKQDLPLKWLEFNYGDFAADKDVFSVSGDIKPGKEYIMPAFDRLLAEAERFRRYGFAQTELDLAKARFRRSLESAYLERDKKANSTFVESYLHNFLENAPVVSAETAYHLLNQVLDTLTLQRVNEMVKGFFSDDNQLITIVTSEADAASIPDRATVVHKLKELPSLAILPYKGKQAPLLEPARPPVPGKVIKEEKVKLGATRWTLSNGATVYLLPTENKKDEILMTAYNAGGHSVLADSDFLSSRLLTTALTASGVGTLSSTELTDALAGKIVYVTPFLGELGEGFDCATSPSDYESMLKLVYLYFTEPRFDKEAFELEIKKLKDNLAARRKNPFAALQDSVIYIRGNHHFRSSNLILDPAEADKVSFERIRELYKQLYANPGDFIYVLTGAIDPAQAKPLIEKYIGGLQGIHRKDHWRDVGKRSPLGEVTIDFKQPMETPKTTTFIEYTRMAPYSYRRSAAMRLLQGVLDIRFNKLLRDERSGTYSTAVEGTVLEFPAGKLQLIVSFDTDPPLMDELTAIVHSELKRLSVEGIDPADLAKSREYLNKSQSQQLKNNYYWHYLINTYARTGEDNFTGNEDLFDKIGPGEVTALLAEILAPHNVVTVTMRPE